MNTQFNVVLTPEDDGIGFVVTSPDIQGLVGYGETRDEALAMAVDAAEGLLMSVIALVEDLPVFPGVAEATTIEVDIGALRRRLAAETAVIAS